MLIGMTKKLKRIRKAKKIEEEGEIMDSDGEEEDGQIKNEDGEMIEIVNKDSNIDVTDIDQEEVEIDIKKFKVPKGKWRVVSKHVQSNKVLIVRYAKQTEIQKANRNTANTDYRTERSNSAVKNRNNRAKSGINVFDSTGKELPWNFEHDTRIFSDPALKDLEVSYEVQKKLNPEQPHEENIQIGDRTIRSRGRGTKRALNLHFSSDEEESDDEKDEDEPMKEAPPSESQTKEAAKEVIDDSILDSPPPSPPKASDNFRNQILGKK
uniref:Uncharacterized protein n=1 Tax=Panagrolaimus sp. ES5 TaxID=591445 RepID=A0AC34F490_9BILA